MGTPILEKVAIERNNICLGTHMHQDEIDSYFLFLQPLKGIFRQHLCYVRVVFKSAFGSKNLSIGGSMAMSGIILRRLKTHNKIGLRALKVSIKEPLE